MNKKINRNILYFIIWYLLGLHGFYLFWTCDDDLTVDYLPVMSTVGLLGPITYLAYIIWDNRDTIILKERQKIENTDDTNISTEYNQ